MPTPANRSGKETTNTISPDNRTKSHKHTFRALTAVRVALHSGAVTSQFKGCKPDGHQITQAVEQQPILGEARFIWVDATIHTARIGALPELRGGLRPVSS